MGKHRGIRWTVDAGRLCIEAVNGQQEDAEEVLGIDYNDTAIDAGFNVDYLLAALVAAQSEQVEIAADAMAHHVQITVPGQLNFLHIIAMMRV